MQDMTMIWNAILTMAVGGFLWWIRATSSAVTKIREENLSTREHIALTYATKQDVKDDLQQIMGRFDRLESKIDDYMRMGK
jgi:hypothetical protein